MKNLSYIQTYKVAFVVHGYIDNEDADIGPVECHGLREYEHQYYLKDGRMYYNVDASSPKKLMNSADSSLKMIISKN